MLTLKQSELAEHVQFLQNFMDDAEKRTLETLNVDVRTFPLNALFNLVDNALSTYTRYRDQIQAEYNYYGRRLLNVAENIDTRGVNGLGEIQHTTLDRIAGQYSVACDNLVYVSKFIKSITR